MAVIRLLLLASLLAVLSACRHDRWLISEASGPLDRTGTATGVYGNEKAEFCAPCLAQLLLLPVLAPIPEPYVTWETESGRHLDARRVAKSAGGWRARFDYADEDALVESLNLGWPAPTRKSYIVSIEPLVVVEVDALAPAWEPYLGEKYKMTVENVPGGYIGGAVMGEEAPLRWYCPERKVAPTQIESLVGDQTMLDTGRERFVLVREGGRWVAWGEGDG
jgi:hypothetical protein